MGRKERRAAEKAAKKAAKKAGVPFDPSPFKVAAPPPTFPMRPIESDDELASFLDIPETEDQLAEWVGVDAAGKYVGEIGEVTDHWQQHHVDCNHGFTTGHWWLIVEGKTVQSVPTEQEAHDALADAGAVTLKGTDFDTFGFDDDDDDDDERPD
jgi:hypothetical protein